MRVYDNEETSLYEHSNESIEFNTLNTNDEIRNYLISCSALILEANFHDVCVDCNGSLLLVRGKHSSLDNFSSHHSIKFFKLNAFIRVFIDTGLFIILHSHW